MSKNFVAVLMCFISWSALAQEKTLFAQSPEDWRPEVIPFPLGFAPEIDLKGVEELRFAPGMFKPEAPDFFSYAFVWSLEGKVDLDTKTLKSDLLAYYAGLYKAVSKLETKNTDGFGVHLRPTAKGFSAEAGTSFRGSIVWREPFATEKEQTLHMLIDKWYCPKEEKTVALFLVSPQPENHVIWETLKTLKLQDCPSI